MIDIHNHLIYEFDDGPRTEAEALDMLRMAVDQGITDVFATSHFNELIPAPVENDYLEKLQSLREEALASDIKVLIYSGAELFYHHFLHKTIKKSRVTTLANLGQYVLLEFPLFLWPQGAEEVLFQLNIEGYIPIVAHPERYQSILDRPQKVLDFIRYGALLQVNAGSILGDFGSSVQKVAMWILENKLAHFIASDAHGTEGRRFKLKEAVDYSGKYVDEEYLQQLVETYPRMILEEQKIERSALPEEEKTNLISKLLRKIF